MSVFLPNVFHNKIQSVYSDPYALLELDVDYFC